MVRFVFVLEPGDVAIKIVNRRWRRRAIGWALAVAALTVTGVIMGLLLPVPSGFSWPATALYVVVLLICHTGLFRCTWLALYDFHPRWAVVHVEGRWRGRRVRMRLDLDAAPDTYRARRLLHPSQPWHPDGKITGLQVNAFSRGDIITIGAQTVSFEQAHRNLNARMARHAA